MGFGLHSKAGMSDPRTELHRLAVSPEADVPAVECRLSRLPSVLSVLQ